MRKINKGSRIGSIGGINKSLIHCMVNEEDAGTLKRRNGYWSKVKNAWFSKRFFDAQDEQELHEEQLEEESELLSWELL